MAKANPTRPIPGKRLLPQLAVGCLLFAALMGYGTYALANLATPYLKKRNEEYMKEHRHPKAIAEPAPAAKPD